MKNKADTNGTPFFAPDFSATVLEAKIFTNSDEHSMYTFLLLNLIHSISKPASKFFSKLPELASS
jgi:hypothetical protein